MKKYQQYIWIGILLITGIIVLINVFTSLERPKAHVPSRELRAIWYSRFEFARSSPTHNQDSIRFHIKKTILNAAGARINTVFFQIRGNGDAYYRSDIEPWGNLLTGELGKDPGWDPLEYALKIAHENGIELHAWINTFPVWRGKTPPPVTDPPSPYLAHPEWVVADSAGNPQPMSDHYVSFSPGIPAVHEYLINLTKDIISRYDVDGIHFDYIRYPEWSVENGYSHDRISVSLFNSKEGNPLGLDFADWQREQLTTFVCKVYNAIKELKPHVKMSAAAIGSYNHGRWCGYNAVFQDASRWMELGKIDFVTPMTYWERRNPTQPFIERVIQWHKELRFDRYIFPGLAAYKFIEKNDLDWNETKAEIKVLRDIGIPGMVFFSANSLKSHWQDLEKEEFRTPAIPPVMNWNDPIPPNPPENVILTKEKNDLKLTWHPPLIASDGELVKYYCIYTSDRMPLDLSNGNNLLAVLPGTTLEFSLDMKSHDIEDNIAITAIDHSYNESVPVVISRGDD